jgi:acyl carrier protein
VTEPDILETLRPLVKEVTGVPVERIHMEHVVMEDLGAESLDLLDLSFLIEERFGVTIGSHEFEDQAKARLPGGVYEKDGFLTPEALIELRKALPEIPPARLAPGLRKLELPSLLTVSVFMHLIQRKLAEKTQVVTDA